MGGRVSPAEHVRQEAGRLFASIVRVEVAVVAAELGDAESGLPAGESIIHVCREKGARERRCAREGVHPRRAELALPAGILEADHTLEEGAALCGWDSQRQRGARRLDFRPQQRLGASSQARLTGRWSDAGVAP